MTAFAKADLPASVDTVEKLAIWALSGLMQLYVEQTAVEGAGTAERVIQFGTYFIPNTNKTRIIARLTVELENDYLTSGKKVWNTVQPLGTETLPATFNS